LIYNKEHKFNRPQKRVLHWHLATGQKKKTGRKGKTRKERGQLSERRKSVETLGEG